MTFNIKLNIFSLILMATFARAYSQERLFENDSYIFLHTDPEVDEMRIKNDTLYKYHCTEAIPCPEDRLEAIVAIKVIRNKQNVFLQEAERLDQYGAKINGASRGITAFKKLDANRIQRLKSFWADSLGRIAASAFIDSFSAATESYAPTFYKLSYLNHLAKTTRAIATVDDVNEIMEAMQSARYKQLLDSYADGVKKGEIKEMYASGLAAEMLTRVCIDLGYNPIRAGVICDGLTRKREQQADIAEPKQQVSTTQLTNQKTTQPQPTEQKVPQDLAGLVSQPQKLISISPKINDPLQYPYPSSKIAAAYYDDFSNSAAQWLERARDSVVENKEVAFGRKNYLQLNTIDSGINLSRASGIDFSKNFEYEIWLVQLPEQKKKLSICLGLDSLTHDHGLTVYIDEKGKFTLYTPDPNSKSKKWRGNTAWLPKKYRSSQMKVTIRHIDGRYDIFVNDRYLKSLKNPPFFRGDGIHVANYQAHSSVIFNAIRIVYL